jgi:hypothetical protein
VDREEEVEARGSRSELPEKSLNLGGLGKAPRELSTGLAVLPAPSPATLEKALTRVKTVMGSWFYAEVKAMNLVQKPDEIIQLAKLTDPQMQECGALLKKGWVFSVLCTT